jgi:hypothetical protein
MQAVTVRPERDIPEWAAQRTESRNKPCTSGARVKFSADYPKETQQGFHVAQSYSGIQLD